MFIFIIKGAEVSWEEAEEHKGWNEHNVLMHDGKKEENENEKKEKEGNKENEQKM